MTYFVGAVLALLQEQVPKIIGKAEISNPNLDRVTTVLLAPGFLVFCFLVVLYVVWWPIKIALAYGALDALGGALDGFSL